MSLMHWSRQRLRSLTRDKQTALAALLTLTLGLGATTAIFTAVDAALYKPLPATDANTLIKLVATRTDKGGHYGVPYHHFHGWQDAQSFSLMVPMRARTVRVGKDDELLRLRATETTPEYLETLGAEMALGRFFDDADGESEKLVVVSHSLWRSRLRGETDAIGQMLRLDGEPHRVIGVMAEGERESYLGYMDLFLPLHVDVAAALEKPLRGFSVLGRLAPGTSLEAARAELATLAAGLEQRYPQYNEGWGVEMHGVRWWIEGGNRRAYELLLMAAGVVLLLVCCNVGGLLLAMGERRSRELALRRALGATPLALVRRLLGDSALLAVLGGALGAGLAYLLVLLIGEQGFASLPRSSEIEVDARVLGFALGASLLTGLLAGLAPAVASLRQRDTLLARRLDRTPRRAVFGRVLVAAQVALATLAVVGSLLLWRSLNTLEKTDPGFEPDKLVTARIELSEVAAELEPAARIAQFNRLIEHLGGAGGDRVCGSVWDQPAA